MILYMLVTGRAPFHEANDSETLTMILDCKFFLPANLSEQCCDLIRRMIVRQPDRRISIADICAHEWLNTPAQCHDDDCPECEDAAAAAAGVSAMTTTATLRPESNNESSDDNWSANTRRGSKRSSSGGSCSSLTNGIRTGDKQHSPSPADVALPECISNPIIKREHLSERDNKEIIKLMVNGNIATEDEISRSVCISVTLIY